MNRPIRLVVASLLGLSTAAASSSARAQSATEDAVYQDVKTVIEDLLTREVSQTVATHIACLGGRRKTSGTTSNDVDISTRLSDDHGPKTGDQFVSLEALTFFPNTLQAVYNERYASLKPVVMGEISTFVAHTAYQLLRIKDDGKRLGATLPPAATAGTAPAAAGAAPVDPRAQEQVQEQLLNTRAALLNHRSVPEAVSPAGAALAAQPEAAISYKPFPERVFDDQLDICAANVGRMISAKQIVVDGTALDKDCNLGQADRDEYACDVAYAVRDSMLGNSKAAEADLLRVMAVYMDELALKNAKTPTPSQDQITSTLVILDQVLSSTGNTLDALKDVPASLATLLNVPKDQIPSVALAALVDQWKAYRLSDGQAISVARLADIAGVVAALVANDCATASASKACTFFPHEREVLGVGTDLWPIIRLVSSGDYVDAAQLTTGILFTGARKACASNGASRVTAGGGDSQEEPSPDSCKVLPYLERFADDIVVYVVQAKVDGTPSDEARSTLRAATEDLVQELALNGGIDRPIVSLKALFLPDLALRYDWSPSFAVDGPGSGRVLASVPWLKVRVPFVRHRLVYSAVAVSLIDVIAPLAELAARAPGITPVHENRIWANVLAPRIDIEGGIPALSKHLLVGGGISYRIVAPAITVPATTTAPASYEYRYYYPWKTDGERGFQFGVFAKYTM